MNTLEIKAIVIDSLIRLGQLPDDMAKEARDADLDLSKITLDSLSVIEICMHLENALGIAVEPVDFLNHSKLNDLADYFASMVRK